MSASEPNTLQLRQRKSTTDSNTNNIDPTDDIPKNEDYDEKREDEIIKIPSKSNVNAMNEPPPLTKRKLISLMIVFFSVFLDFMGVSLVQPILPYYAEVFNANSTELGALYSSYSAMSLLASFGMGKFSDKFGRKPMILFSLFGTCIGFLATGLAQNYAQLLAFRFLTGFFGATAPVAMAVITDTVPSPSRPKYLAGVGAVIALSFIVGPGIGSGLAEFNIRVPFFVSSGFGCFGFIFALFLLKESHPKILRARAFKQQQKAANEDKNETRNKLNGTNNSETKHLEMEQVISEKEHGKDFDEMDRIKIIRDNGDGRTNDSVEEEEVDGKIPIQVWILCVVNTLKTLGITVYTAIFTLYVIDLHDLSSLSVGYAMLTMAVIAVFANVLFLNLSNYLGMYITTIIACFEMGLALIIAPFIKNIWGLLAIIVFGVGFGYGQILPAMSALAASWTNVKNRGVILGLAGVFDNIGFIVGPMLHGVLYGEDKAYPFYFGGCCTCIGGIMMIIMIFKWPHLKDVGKKKEEDRELREDKDPENWEYIPDKITRKDYMRLGKAFGTMLSERNYNWKIYFDKLLECLDDMFPVLRVDSLENRSHDIKFIIRNAKEVRQEFDNIQATLNAVPIKKF